LVIWTSITSNAASWQHGLVAGIGAGLRVGWVDQVYTPVSAVYCAMRAV
jgi:hypothetical protein